MKNLTVSEAMALMNFSGNAKATAAFKKMLENNDRRAWFIVAGRLKKQGGN